MYSFQFVNVNVYIFIIAVFSLKYWIISIHWLLNDPFGSYKTTTSHALINVTENKIKALDDCRLWSFCWLTKSFWHCMPPDTVGKNESLWDLWSFKWLVKKSYFSNCSQCVSINGYTRPSYYILWHPSRIYSRTPSVFIIFKQYNFVKFTTLLMTLICYIWVSSSKSWIN